VRKKRLLGWLVFGAVAAAAAAWLPLPATSPVATERGAKAGERAQPSQAVSRFATLPQREAIGKPARPIFSSQSWNAAPQNAAALMAPVAPPAAPPMPYRVAGTVSQDGALQIVLARGDAVLMVREGDTLDGAYQVEKVQPERVTLVYLPLGTREDLPMNSALALDESSPRPAPLAAAAPAAAGASAPEPAKLRWEGPQRVTAGSTFDVALKVTSAEAVRAAPLQLVFDAKVLEPVAVRAGGFFSDGLFSYRVLPGGSIFIGASGKGSVAADAEFLVVRFKPIGAPGTAELKISSVSLQDTTGRAIAYQQPAPFRTIISQ